MCLFSNIINSVRLWGQKKHKKNIQISKKVIKKLSEFESNGQAIAYLRKINPYVFEDLALSLLESRGIFVLRSKSYSGDGGMDGQFYWPKKGWYAVQSKRYGKAINPAHARAFAQLVNKKFKGGLFVHTGRTGETSEEALASESLYILSGADLAECARNKKADLLAMTLMRKNKQKKTAIFNKNK